MQPGDQQVIPDPEVLAKLPATPVLWGEIFLGVIEVAIFLTMCALLISLSGHCH
jgi:hypothetical protein